MQMFALQCAQNQNPNLPRCLQPDTPRLQSPTKTIPVLPCVVVNKVLEFPGFCYVVDAIPLKCPQPK